jgi:thioredoxin-related protein
MKTTRFLIILTTLLLGGAIALQAGAERKLKPPKKDPNGIDWYNYEAGWEKAKAENKHMFVDFTATWCGWCKKLEATTFAQAAVIKALTEDFVAVKVWQGSPDTLQIDGLIIAEEDLRLKEFRANSFPQLWFVSPKGVRVGPIKGYVQAAQLLQYFDQVQHYRYDSTIDESGQPIETKQP